MKRGPVGRRFGRHIRYYHQDCQILLITTELQYTFKVPSISRQKGWKRGFANDGALQEARADRISSPS